jgi:glucuronate isomerase
MNKICRIALVLAVFIAPLSAAAQPSTDESPSLRPNRPVERTCKGFDRKARRLESAIEKAKTKLERLIDAHQELRRRANSSDCEVRGIDSVCRSQ